MCERPCFYIMSIFYIILSGTFRQVCSRQVFDTLSNIPGKKSNFAKLPSPKIELLGYFNRFFGDISPKNSILGAS